MNFRNGPGAVLLDLDGTLIDSVPDVHACVNEMLNLFGRPPLPLGEVRRMVGRGARVLVKMALSAAGTPSDRHDLDRAIEIFLAAYQANATRHTTVYPGVINTLGLIEGAGMRVAICTNKPKVMTELVLDQLGLSIYIDAVSCGDQLPFQKPDARHVRHALGLVGSSAEQAVFVGDSRHDLVAAKDADVRMIAVAYGYGDRGELSGAMAIVDAFPDIVPHLGLHACSTG